MTQHRHPQHRATTAVTLALVAGAVGLLPAAAVAAASNPTGHDPKAAIEHAEREAAAQASPARKAQVEHAERLAVSLAASPAAGLPAPTLPAPAPPATAAAPSGDAAAWQLALSAAVGALVTGAVVVAGRRLGAGGGRTVAT